MIYPSRGSTKSHFETTGYLVVNDSRIVWKPSFGRFFPYENIGTSSGPTPSKQTGWLERESQGGVGLNIHEKSGLVIYTLHVPWEYAAVMFRAYNL